MLCFLLEGGGGDMAQRLGASGQWVLNQKFNVIWRETLEGGLALGLLRPGGHVMVAEA